MCFLKNYQETFGYNKQYERDWKLLVQHSIDNSPNDSIETEPDSESDSESDALFERVKNFKFSIPNEMNSEFDVMKEEINKLKDEIMHLKRRSSQFSLENADRLFGSLKQRKV